MLSTSIRFEIYCNKLNSPIRPIRPPPIRAKVLWKLLKHSIRTKRYSKESLQLSGTPTASSTSPYCIKVEAFCRLHEIKFEVLNLFFMNCAACFKTQLNCFRHQRRNTLTARGQNDLLPFIELNGEQYSDSQIILRRLTQIFKLNVDFTIWEKFSFSLHSDVSQWGNCSNRTCDRSATG